jgi:hypothetical protein
MKFTKTFLRKKFPDAFIALKRVLSYSHPGVVDRFVHEYRVERKFAEAVFKDLRRYLWLVHLVAEIKERDLPELRSLELKVPMFKLMNVMDHFWHVFLLFSEDYENFCEEHFGRRIHHVPEPVSEEIRFNRMRQPGKHLLTPEFRSFVDFVWVALGSDVANRWFLYSTDYRVYSRKTITARRKRT